MGKTINISLPENLLKAADQVAKVQDRSRSELIRESLRAYVKRARAWEEVFSYGEKKAKSLGLKTEEDVIDFLEE